MNFTEIFVIFIVAIIILMFIQNHFSEVEYVRSRLDGRNYLVCKLPQQQEAADYLAEVNAKLTQLIRHMISKYNSKEAIQLYQNYNPDMLSEGSYTSGFTSFTVNKVKLVLCIRQRDNTFVSKNTIMYVAIHELAHMATKELGHTETFWQNFKWLLEEAVAIGLYKKTDFNKTPQDYCGIKISTSIL
jgi:hypothetical protein